MLVVNVRVVRMAVRQQLMGVRVRMWLGAVPREIVGVVVMDVVHVTMAVGDGLVRVHALVAFGQVQPHPDTHQECRNPKTGATRDHRRTRMETAASRNGAVGIPMKRKDDEFGERTKRLLRIRRPARVLLVALAFAAASRRRSCRWFSRCAGPMRHGFEVQVR